MKWAVAVKGGGKVGMMTRTKWVGLVGVFLSVFSLSTHFLLAKYTDYGGNSEISPVTVFDKTISRNSGPPRRRLWGPLPQFGFLHPYSNPREEYAAPSLLSTGFVFVRIQGGFHEIRTAICDAVVVARLLNATLVIPEILSATSSKGISSQFKSFAYLYNEEQFMAALAKDVKIVKTLPKNLKEARRRKEIPAYRVSNSASPYFYLHHVLPVLKKHSVVELVISDGGCLQVILPPNLEEYQRLRCRVTFHALQFRQEVQELATKVLNRLRVPGQPYIAYEPGLSREALAYHGCAELFQDVHTELIQHKRAWMIKRGIIKEKLSVNSAEKRLSGVCPLTPEEIGIILRAYGYPSDTIIYISGGEVFGGQRILIPLHAMFNNVIDRTTLSTSFELKKVYGRESDLVNSPPSEPDIGVENTNLKAWKNAGPRPRPLPPPPARPKTYNVEGWWGWVAESDNEPDSTVIELRTNAHKLLWEAIDYLVCTEADVFISGFDLDGKGRPNFASLVTGHRLYQSAASVTFRPDRKEMIKYIEELRDSLYQVNRTWLSSVRRHMRETLIDGLLQSSSRLKPKSFLSHTVPECSCSSNNRTPTEHSGLKAALGSLQSCPSWMKESSDSSLFSSNEKENEDEINDIVEKWSSGAFFRRPGEGGSAEASSKEEAALDDQDDLESAER
ncbi:hypothetical protein V2J09_023315 [Rumex salicifolius]